MECKTFLPPTPLGNQKPAADSLLCNHITAPPPRQSLSALGFGLQTGETGPLMNVNYCTLNGSELMLEGGVEWGVVSASLVPSQPFN